MIKNSQSIMLDKVDKSLLRALQADGRLSNVELARKISLSPPAAHARLRRLEKDGYIRQYTAVVDREKAGYDLLCFIHISLQMHQVTQVEKFREATRKMPEVLECHHITGEYDYLLKVVLAQPQGFGAFRCGQTHPHPWSGSHPHQFGIYRSQIYNGAAVGVNL